MLLFLLSLLAQDPEESLREKALRLSKDPVANKAELLKLGPGAIRPLVDVHNPDLDAILRELKFAGQGEAVQKIKETLETKRLTMRVKNMKVDLLVRFLGDTAKAPIFIDPGMHPSIESKVASLDLNHATLAEWLASAAEASGLEYGVVRGAVVFSTPERLWPYPSEKPRLLDEAAVKALKEQIERLNGDSAPVREAASRAIVDVGEAAVPHLEAALRGLADDRRARVREVLDRIRARTAPSFFSGGLSLEKQELTDSVKTVLAALQAKKASLDTELLQLAGAFKVILAQADVQGEVASSAEKLKISCDLRELRALDALYFLAVTHGYDACIKDGRVWIDTREKIEKLLKDK